MAITRIQAEQKLYQCLTVWQEDFRNASYFANHLLRKGWHFDPWDRKIRWPTYMQQAAFTTALVAAYCRPFTGTRSGATISMKLAHYTKSELELHRKLKTLRNTIYAHSDVELREVRPMSINGSASAIESLPSLKLTQVETQLAISMIAKIMKSIDEKRNELISRVEE